MNKNFAPGMVMLNGTISPGSSGNYGTGIEGGDALMYRDSETGYIFFYFEGIGWICEENDSLIYDEIQKGWIPVS